MYQPATDPSPDSKKQLKASPKKIRKISEYQKTLFRNPNLTKINISRHFPTYFNIYQHFTTLPTNNSSPKSKKQPKTTSKKISRKTVFSHYPFQSLSPKRNLTQQTAAN
jgi:hypothetical protein